MLTTLALTALGAPTKAEVVTLTKDQWDSLNNKLELWAYGFLAFIAKEVWDIFKNRGKNLSDIEKSITAMNETIKSLVTKDEAQDISRREIKHYHDIQR